MTVKSQKPKRSRKKVPARKRALPLKSPVSGGIRLVPAPAEKPMRYRCKYCAQNILFDSKIQKKKWVKSGFICPHCRVDMCCLPPTERDLMKLQKQYFEQDRAPHILGSMYGILKSYAQSIILKKHLYQVDPKDLPYHAHMAAWYLVEHYYNNPDFKIKISFGAYLNSTVYQAVYHKPKGEDRTVSIDIENDESRKVYEILSSTDLDREVQQRVDPDLVLKHLARIIDDTSDFAENSADDEYRLRAVLLFLTHGQAAVDRFFQHHERRGKLAFDRTMEVLRSELHRMHSGA
jgi:hypothetical protein